MKLKLIKKNVPEYFALKIKGKSIGYAVCKVKGNLLKIPYISLNEQFRGKGFGNILMKKIIGFGKANNCNSFELSVFMENQRAINLYEKFGFKKNGIVDTYYKMTKI